MKNKLSFLSLVAAAALTCGNALAENNVIVYDETKNQVVDVEENERHFYEDEDFSDPDNPLGLRD